MTCMKQRTAVVAQAAYKQLSLSTCVKWQLAAAFMNVDEGEMEQLCMRTCS